MKYLKKIRLYVLYLHLLFTPIFASSLTSPLTPSRTSLLAPSSTSSFGSPRTSPRTSSNEKNSIEKKPNPISISPFEHELNDNTPNMKMGASDLPSPSILSPVGVEQGIRSMTNTPKRSADENKLYNLGKNYKEIIDKNLELITNDIITEIEINEMIKQQEDTLSDKEQEFLSTMNSISPTKLNPGLIKMIDIPQIEKFNVITRNFTDASKLEPYAILYLNACAEFYPFAKTMNEAVSHNPIEIKITNTETIYISSFDFFHVFIGEMNYFKHSNESSKNKSTQKIDSKLQQDIDKLLDKIKLEEVMKPEKYHLSSMLSGGHLYIPSLTPKIRLLTTFIYDKITHYFNLTIKTLAGNEKSFKTYFPYGTTPEECLNILKRAIDRYHKLLKNGIQSNKKNDAPYLLVRRENGDFYIKLLQEDGIIMNINIDKNGRATFYPSLPVK